MKATLEFNLPEDREEHNYALNGILYSIVLDEIDNFLRTKLKYHYESLSEDTQAAYQEIRDLLHQEKAERNL